MQTETRNVLKSKESRRILKFYCKTLSELTNFQRIITPSLTEFIKIRLALKSF